MPLINSWYSQVPVEIAKGGTNAVAMATPTGIVKYDGASLVTSTAAMIDAQNIYTNSAQPGFLATAAAQANVTGDGTPYIAQFTNVVYDQAHNYDGISTFTAPVTGKYLFTYSLLMGATAAMTVGEFDLITTLLTFRCNIGPSNVVDNNGNFSENFSVVANMNAGDTAFIRVTFFNGALAANIARGYYSASLLF